MTDEKKKPEPGHIPLTPAQRARFRQEVNAALNDQADMRQAFADGFNEELLGTLQKVGSTLHAGIEEAFTALAHDKQSAVDKKTQKAACAETHKCVDAIMVLLVGEPDDD